MSAYLFLPNIDQESINQISYPEIAPAPPSATLNTPVGLPPAKRSEGARFDKGPGFWPKHRGIQGECVKWGLFLQAGISAKMVRFGRFPSVSIGPEPVANTRDSEEHGYQFCRSQIC